MITKTDLFVDDDIQVDYAHHNMMLYGIAIFSFSGSKILAELYRSRYLLAPRTILRDNYIVLIGKSDTVSVPQPGDTTWLPQYSANFTFNNFDTSSEVNQKILEYELFGKFDDDDVVIDDQF